MGIPAVAVVMLAASQAVVTPAPSATSSLPISVERVREALERPALKIPPIDVTPVFRAKVDEVLFDNPLQGMRRELGARSGYSGGSGIDILPLAVGLVKSIKAKYRAYSEVRIRKEVAAELTAFCAERDCSVLEDGPPPMEGILLPRQRP